MKTSRRSPAIPPRATRSPATRSPATPSPATLHTFPPSEVKDLVRDYLDLAYEKGLRHLRIIHGKGMGVQRRTVRKLLERDPRVAEYGDPPGEAGGWGATWVRME